MMAPDCRLFILSLLLLFLHGTFSQSYLDLEKQRLNAFKKSYNNSKSDIIFFIDVSGSLSDYGFDTEKYFVKSMLNQFSVAHYSTRVVIITFGSRSKTDVDYINLEGKNLEETTKCEFNKIFDYSVKHRYAGSTNMNSAFKQGNSILETANALGWKRANVNTAAFLITDGYWNRGGDPAGEARKMKTSQFNVDVFSVGVGYVKEWQLKDLASSNDKYIYARSFTAFKKLARYIRGDAHEKIYMKVSNSRCATPCHSKAVCTCGTVGGRYVCSCLAGYSGNGITCTPCPRGSYKDYPSPEKCIPCPKHSNTGTTGSKTLDACTCNRGYEGDPKRKIECTPIKCPPIGAPSHGKMSGANCNQIYNGKCFFECNTGYLRDGPPFRVCQANREWSGKLVQCDVLKCNDIPTLHHGSAVCTGSKYQDSCTFTCSRGYELIGSNEKKCQANGQWTGSDVVRCEAKKCPVLRKLAYGRVEPVDCVTRSQNFGAGCIFKCNSGYTMEGEGNLRCQEDGTWTKTVPTCKDTQPPEVYCPKSMTKTTDKGKSFATVEFSAPEYFDNSQLFQTVDIKVKKEPEGIKSPHAFPLGLTTVTYTVEDQEGNINRCSFNVLVEDKEPPTVLSCPQSKVLVSQSQVGTVTVTWDPVLFIDNSADPLTIRQSHQNNTQLSNGQHSVTYTAIDKAKNVAQCRFVILVHTQPCKAYPPPVNGGIVAMDSFSGIENSPVCNKGFEFSTKPAMFYTCFTTGDWFTWPPDAQLPWPDCTVEYNADARKGFEFNYLSGDCKDPKVQLEAKKAFLKQFNVYLQDFYPDYCDIEQSCTVENVVVLCGVSSHSGRRRKRAIPGKSLFINVDVKIENKKGRSTQSLLNALNSATESKLKSSSKLKNLAVSGQTLNIDDVRETLAKVSCRNGTIHGLNVDHADKCQSCPAGTKYDLKTTKCQDCPKDTYQEDSGKLFCNKCSTATFTIGSKSKNSSDCRAKCPVGEYSQDGLENCLACPLDHYQHVEGSTQCIKCPGGTITTSVAAKSIRECGVPCAPGSYSATGVEVCTLCPVGQYQPSLKQKKCIQCPNAHTTTSEGAISKNECRIVNPCNLNPCNNGGNCVAKNTGYKCVCQPGYRGSHCADEINECETSPCYEGSTCLDKVNGYVCVCAAGQSGQHCDQKTGSFCADQPCHRGKCIEEPDRFVCSCPPGYTGRFCETEINECASIPCENGGKCSDLHPGYKCECPSGYDGVRCQIDKDGCSSDPCVNGARCESLGKDFQCHCVDGYRGKRCEVNVNECSSSPCRNSGKCIDLINDYKCDCQRNFGGKSCEIARSMDYDITFSDAHGISSSTLQLDKDISAFTVALWMKVSDPRTTDPGTPLSYAVKYQGKLLDNALVIHDYTGFNIYINNEKYETDIDGDDGKWHHIAVTWQSSSGSLVFYKDGDAVAHGNIQKNKLIPGGGLLVLGQEQDIVGGDFSASEAFEGDISQVNMWDHVISTSDIKTLASHCAFEKHGNLVAWGDFLNGLEGNAQVSPTSNACKANRCWGNWLNRGSPRSCSNPSGYDCQSGDGLSLKNVDNVASLKIKCTNTGVQCQNNNEATCPTLKVRFACPCSESSMCTSQTCKNGGTCLNRINGYQCQCKEGFIGDHCQTELQCPDPRPFAHGTVTGSTFRPGSSVSFQCDQGFRLVGDSALVCRRGKWQGTVPKCVDIDECASGSCAQQVCKNTIGGFQCTCAKGYRLGSAGKCEDINECLTNNGNCQGLCKNTLGSYSCLPCSAKTKLTKDGLKCEDINECMANNGRGPCDHFCENIFGGYKCKCRSGFSVRGDNCHATTCPVLSAPANGKIIPSTVPRNVDAVVTFSCNQNYKLIGSKSRTCLVDGTWSGIQPSCPQIRCQPAPALLHGHKSSNANHAGAQISYTCNSGFKMVGQAQITCQADTRWSSPAPRCIRTDCPQPSAPNHGTVAGSQTTIGSIIQYECSESQGYKFADVNSPTHSECLASKQWSNPKPTCQLVNCGDPGGLSQGHRSGSILTYNGVVTYSCNSGYKISGPASRTCQFDGTWSGVKPQCLAQSCGDPGTPANGLKGGIKYTYGGRVTFNCNKGYKLVGSNERVCQSTGQWSGVEAQCVTITCTDPGIPTNGERTGTDMTAGSTLYYNCKPGYKPIGETKLECGYDGKWSAASPTCLQSQCGGFLHGPSGSLKSPNFPNLYGNNLYCRWKITVPVNKKVLIKLKSFDSEKDKDWLLVYDPTVKKTLSALSGINANEMFFTSSSNEMEVTFISDAQRQSFGFEATYQQVSCGGVITDLNTVIQSPSYPNNYQGDLTCVWEVLLPGKSIALDFESFQTRQGYDFLEVRNRVDKFNADTLVARYSGYMFMPGSLESLQGYMHLVFSSRGRYNFRGFKAKVVNYQPTYGK